MNLFEKLKEGLARTRKTFTEQLEKLTGGYTKIDDEFLEELEAVLLTSDIGVNTAQKLLQELKQAAAGGKITGASAVRGFLQERVAGLLAAGAAGMSVASKPAVVLVVGVNGAGKTTTIGKLGSYYHESGLKVMFAAADTFRAAAAEQLEIWANRCGADLLKHAEGSDPAAVVFDALKAARARGVDMLFIDTAGRLHNKTNLMEELKKIHRVIKREIPDAPHETLLAIDATTGQNAVAQAKIFTQAAQATGIVLTKLDGTAKGGVVVAIKDALGIPVKWIGIGEGQKDFRPFDPVEFSKALFAETTGKTEK
ncbi:MAG: signal recognition particle-docking protein FtsY [Acidaminococcales bacterium]|jgi:fused signal recognition particle receptor|nr:signal recognition particle-docking protein FtsY [Acidaminococcales bacterium]